jgi:mannose-1-phosphate guanylyltransferase/mannose-6-phosphate isomerase
VAKKPFYAVILAGGIGSRFWPLSRGTSPKQLLRVAGDESLLTATIKRIRPLIPPANISIVTNAAQAETIRLHLLRSLKGALPQFIVEPAGRNTAAAVGLAALRIIKKDPDAVMAVLPSDHLIREAALFRKTLRAGYGCAEDGRLITFGVVPTGPETGYGYIKAGNPLRKINGFSIKKAERFVEKPDTKRARRFLREGNYYWNSGVFVWKALAILDEIKRHLPAVYRRLLAAQTDPEAYRTIPSISIDRGVLEKSPNVAVMEARFRWSDMGSWSALDSALARDGAGNIIRGRVVDEGSRNSFIIGCDRVVATIGLKDMIIVDTPDATLVTPKKRAQEVKNIVEKLKKKGHPETETHVTAERPWGSYTVLETGDRYKIKKIRVLPGARLSMQLHGKRSEHWVVISGRALVQRDKETIEVKPNESTYIPVGVKHRLSNPGRAILEIIEVQMGEYIAEDDIVRFEDDYARIPTGTER